MIFLSYFIFLFRATQQLSKIKEQREHLATNKWLIVVLYTLTRDDIFCQAHTLLWWYLLSTIKLSSPNITGFECISINSWLLSSLACLEDKPSLFWSSSLSNPWKIIQKTQGMNLNEDHSRWIFILKGGGLIAIKINLHSPNSHLPHFLWCLRLCNKICILEMVRFCVK